MGKGHGERLSRKQELAIAALLGQPTIEEAAQTVGVNEKTLRTWLKLPTFHAEFRAARRRIVEGAITRLQQLTLGAVLALHRNLTSGNPAVEIRAAHIILDQSTKAIELDDVLQRIDELEARLAAREKSPTQRYGA